jgi:hypothetical protein
VLDGDRLAQAVSQDPEAVHADLGQALQHPAGDLACDDGPLEGVAVDQHRGLQRLEAGDAQRVEHPCARPAQVGLAGSHRPHHLLLGVVGVVPPWTLELDPQVAAGTLLDQRHEVLDGRNTVEVAVGVGHPQHHRLTGATGLVATSPAAATASRHNRRDHGKGNGREPGSPAHPPHGPTPFLEGRGRR